MSEYKENCIEVTDFSFRYPKADRPALQNVRMEAAEGSFVVLCGKSGCGKSTLLRQMKSVLAPAGDRSGQIRYRGRNLDEVGQREQSAGIGYVLQNPENQIVTDKVWHELAFGLESLGYDTPTIRLRVAEMASYFGIQDWFLRNVSELSGGQKQLLNLASVMAMHPDLLILDEPTSQLDPIAASDFLETVRKINRDIGTTVILTEHRLEDVIPWADRVYVMDDGRMIAEGEPDEIGRILKGKGDDMFLAMPAPMQIYAGVDSDFACPLTVSGGRRWLTAEMTACGAVLPDKIAKTGRAAEETVRGFEAVENVLYAGETGRTAEEAARSFEKPEVRGGNHSADPVQEERAETGPGQMFRSGRNSSGDPGREERAEDASQSDGFGKKKRVRRAAFQSGQREIPAIRMRDVWFRYERELPDVVKGLSMDVRQSEIFALVGGNGTGKSTSMNLIARILRPYRGKIWLMGKEIGKYTDAELYHGFLGVMPQNPQSLFVKKTVREDLYEIIDGTREKKSSAYPIDMKKADAVSGIAALTKLEGLLERHPYDISGGEQQRLALAKVLLLRPRILLMDEPTKGIDNHYKKELGEILRTLTRHGVTVLLISHDVEFCAQYADRVGLFFQGNMVTCNEAGPFFAGNSFYTTAANRMARAWFPEAVTADDVIREINRVKSGSKSAGGADGEESAGRGEGADDRAAEIHVQPGGDSKRKQE